MTAPFKAIEILLPTLNQSELKLVLIQLVNNNEIDVVCSYKGSKTLQAVEKLVSEITKDERNQLGRRISKILFGQKKEKQIKKSVCDLEKRLNSALPDEDPIWEGDPGDCNPYPIVTKTQLDEELVKMARTRDLIFEIPAGISKSWAGKLMDKALNMTPYQVESELINIKTGKFVKGYSPTYYERGHFYGPGDKYDVIDWLHQVYCDLKN